MDKINILDLSLMQLQEILKTNGFPAYRALQVLNPIYKGNVSEFPGIKNIPEELRLFLMKKFELMPAKIINKQASSDGTGKYLLLLNDGEKIESVIIPAKDRLTACLSTQVGCKFGCKFCASGILGFKRNLSSGEIISQLILCAREAKRRITNIVFMGVGEPLDNYENLMKAIRIINSPGGINIGARRITVSTCGIPDKIKRLSQEGLQVELAISLHGYNDETRSRLMPVNKKYPLGELLSECRRYSHETKRQITFEYLLVKGLTCIPEAAGFLAKALKGITHKLNLIVYNEVKELGFIPPTDIEIKEFERALETNGIHAVLRASKGRDISAACGQLRIKACK
ncbi:MAG: 23S rRNA (adenine(2503)-C(2))-methyltransferase RlmN [Candidatus Omnitrophica bacterium]|nr:23S rRNA (adenine(2503)-C(2))-methyltransferase RlmN [Candidatus Omnitrophota bacterium]